jgi:ABC-type nitrate/sulfonate/bicarbonate transport system substrate-binding protein
MLGLFEKYGLEAEVIGFEGDAKTLQAITAGQIDFGVGAAANVISSQLTDAPLAMLAVGNLTNRDALWCQAEIKTADDVRGKSIGISTFGGTSHASALAALDVLGLTSDDVTITQVGAEAARVAALVGGSVGCIVAIADYPGDAMTGMNAVVKMSEARLLIAASTTFASKEWLAKYPNTALVALAAMLEAHNAIFAEPDVAAEKWVEFAQVSREDADAFVQDVVNFYNRSLMWPDEALENPKATLVTIRPEIAEVDLAACSDHSFLDKLRDIGFYNKIGLPLT